MKITREEFLENAYAVANDPLLFEGNHYVAAVAIPVEDINVPLERVKQYPHLEQISKQVVDKALSQGISADDLHTVLTLAIADLAASMFKQGHGEQVIYALGGTAGFFLQGCETLIRLTQEQDANDAEFENAFSYPGEQER